jgi:hypothetical protein
LGDQQKTVTMWTCAKVAMKRHEQKGIGFQQSIEFSDRVKNEKI